MRLPDPHDPEASLWDYDEEAEELADVVREADYTVDPAVPGSDRSALIDYYNDVDPRDSVEPVYVWRSEDER